MQWWSWGNRRGSGFESFSFSAVRPGQNILISCLLLLILDTLSLKGYSHVGDNVMWQTFVTNIDVAAWSLRTDCCRQFLLYTRFWGPIQNIGDRFKILVTDLQ